MWESEFEQSWLSLSFFFFALIHPGIVFRARALNWREEPQGVNDEVTTESSVAKDRIHAAAFPPYCSFL